MCDDKIQLSDANSILEKSTVIYATDQCKHTFNRLDHFRPTMKSHFKAKIIGHEEIGYALLICISNDGADDIFISNQLVFLLFI